MNENMCAYIVKMIKSIYYFSKVWWVILGVCVLFIDLARPQACNNGIMEVFSWPIWKY